MSARAPLGLLTLLAAGALNAQAGAPAAAPISMVGRTAPDFSIAVVSSKDGVAPRPFRLSEHRGETVVLAFFYQARSRG